MKFSQMLQIAQLLEKHEGLRLFPYKDTVGKLTIGIGRNLIDRGITREEALMMLENDIKYFTEQLSKELPWFDSKPDNVKLVLIDMAFNLGIYGLLNFKNTLGHIERGEYKEASVDMLNSLWAKQVGIRAIELANMLRET
jgi:lysozyme